MIRYRVAPPGFELNGNEPPAAIPTAPVYSGHGPGLNDSGLEAVRDVGPIPRGRWRVAYWTDAIPHKGPCVAVLLPDGWEAFGRSGFLIHGDNREGNKSASRGCIIAPRLLREWLRSSGDEQLEVV